MAAASLSDHVMIFDDALASAHCEALIARFESSPDQEACVREHGHSFTQLDITRHWSDENAILIPAFLSCFNKYQVATNAGYWPPRFCFEHLRMKRYLPNGSDSFPAHVDVMCHDAARRFMTAIVYLNATEGGETIFPNLDLSVAPTAGKCIAFPPLWLFPHAGQPPRSKPKYILHTYLCYPPAAQA
jgi:prolyl 4-hydroxylase